jgi:hypothetical protein
MVPQGMLKLLPIEGMLHSMAGGKPKERKANNPLVVWPATVALIALGIALIASLVNLWPVIERDASSSTTTPVATVRLFFATVTVKASPSTALLLLVVLAGGLGSIIHAATSLGDFVGNRRFYSSWSAWYLLRPLVGAALATLVYFAVRGGFLSGSSSSSNINPYGIAAVAGLAGLFSKQATDKLREVFETLFHVSARAGDAQRKDDLANAVPTISALDPTHVTVGSTGVKLSVNGEHFIDGTSVCRVDGVAQETTIVSPQLMEVTLPDDALADRGALKITVFTGPPGGGESEPLSLPIV